MQNRFIVFDKRLQPGEGFEEGLIFDHGSFHNIPGFPDNVRVRCCSSLFCYQGLTVPPQKCTAAQTPQFSASRQSPGWRGAVQILSTVPTVDWVSLGSGESDKG